MSFRKKISTIGGYYFSATRALVAVAAFLVFVLMIYITADVAGRYLANSPMPATYEIGETFLVIIAFLTFAYVQARKSHMRLEVLSQYLGARGQAMLDIFAYLIGLFLFTLIIWQGWGWAWESWQLKDYMQGVFKIPYYPSKFALVVGAFFLWGQFVIDLIRRIGQLSGVEKGVKGDE